MAIPDFQTIMRPLLEHLAQVGEASDSDADEYLAQHFQLTDQELEEMLPSGRAPAFKNRAGWARFHLRAADLIEAPERGVHRVTAQGREVLKEPFAVINMDYLRQSTKHQARAEDGAWSCGYWVGKLGEKVLVVFDPSLQPKDPKWAYLYFVHGNAIKTRLAERDRKFVARVRDPHTIGFAVSHYEKWKETSKEELERRRAITYFEEESPPRPREECPCCRGEGSWRWTVGTFSEGGHSDGQHFHDICAECRGSGYIDILS